jgi:hypothetical protein
VLETFSIDAYEDLAITIPAEQDVVMRWERL